MNSGDYLHGFFLGTRDALYEKDRKSITLTILEITPAAIGRLIALFERAVGLYASLVKINAYHQPGVEAGKKAAVSILAVRQAVEAFLLAHPQKAHSATEIASSIGKAEKVNWVFKILESLAVNRSGEFVRIRGPDALNDQFRKK